MIRTREYNTQCVQGATLDFSMQILVNQNSVEYDGYTITSTIRDSYDIKRGEFQVSLSNGVIYLSLPAQITSTLKQGYYFYDVCIKKNDYVYIPIRGRINILSGFSRCSN